MLIEFIYIIHYYRLLLINSKTGEKSIIKESKIGEFYKFQIKSYGMN